MKYEYIPRQQSLYLKSYPPRKEMSSFMTTLGAFSFIAVFFIAISIFGAAF